jgi:hypothetical protein
MKSQRTTGEAGPEVIRIHPICKTIRGKSAMLRPHAHRISLFRLDPTPGKIKLP